MAILIIGGILFFLGVIVGLLSENLVVIRVALHTVYIAIFLVIGGAFYCAVTSARPEPVRPVAIEYPASEYRLKLRIVEFEGQRDTTYVLVKKIKE